MNTKLITKTESILVKHPDISTDITDEMLINRWLRNKSKATQECYRSMIKHFCQKVDKPLNKVTLNDIYEFLDYLIDKGYKSLSIADYTIPIKSLFRYGHKHNILQKNVADLLKKPKYKFELAQRILLPEEVFKMIHFETNLRNKLILKVLYLGGLRASELCGLKWRDVQECSDGAVQLTVFGKGNKTRFVKLPPKLSGELLAFRANASRDAPVFRSRYKKNGGHIRRQHLGVIVKEAAQRAGLEGNVSPHWLRHSHASHALEKGASIQLVQATLGHSNIKTTEFYLHVQPGESSGHYLKFF